MSVNWTKPTTVTRYDSWSDLIAFCESRSNAWYAKTNTYASELGTDSYASLMRLMHTGDETHVPKALALLDAIERILVEGATKLSWSPAPYGAYPCVPDYIAGFPENMRTLTPSAIANPANIYVSLSIPGFASTEQLIARGAAIMALVMVVQQTRPTNLYLMLDANIESGRSNKIVIAPIDTNPLSVAHASYALCHKGFLRRVRLNATLEKDVLGVFGVQDFQLETFRSVIGAGPNDLIIPRWTDLTFDPIAWVNQQIDRFNQGSM